MSGFLKTIESVAGQTIGLIRENGQVEDCQVVDESEVGSGAFALVQSQFLNNLSFPTAANLALVANGSAGETVLSGDPAFLLSDDTIGQVTYVGTAPLRCLLELNCSIGSASVPFLDNNFMAGISVNNDLLGAGIFSAAAFQLGAGMGGILANVAGNSMINLTSRRLVTLQPNDLVFPVGACASGDARIAVQAFTLTLGKR